jgi:APA family basic amino acid/polyamine antiporter
MLARLRSALGWRRAEGHSPSARRHPRIKWRIKPIDHYVSDVARKPLRRSCGALQLTMLGVGGMIGTGIFVLTALGAERAGPSLMLSFVIAAAVCACAALTYAEIASMVPVAGTAYAYSYVSMGEFVAWVVGWNLILEYGVAAAVVAVGWSGYVVGLLASIGWDLPVGLTSGALAGPGGVLNVLAVLIIAALTALIATSTRTSAMFGSILVVAKLSALTLFLLATLPNVDWFNFQPFMPYGFGSTDKDGVARGVMAAASLIFFAYLGFDAVSTAAEETRNPNRNVPIAIVGSLAICTVVYILVTAGAIGTTPYQELAGSTDPLALILRKMGRVALGNLIAVAAIATLPTVILILLYGQTRIFFVMARDRLLPGALSEVHARFGTPHRVTMATSALVALLAGLGRADEIAELSNAGSLFAFSAVGFALVVLRISQPHRPRPFRCPAPWLVVPAAVGGCGYLFYSLSTAAQARFAAWTAIGVAVYFLYGYRRSSIAA